MQKEATRTQEHTHTHTPGHNSAALWSREGSVTPQRLCDSPPITQSQPHLISPVNERLSVSGAAIGRWAPSVTVSGKCRSMGSAEKRRTCRFRAIPPQSHTAAGRGHRGRRRSLSAAWTHQRRGNKNMTQGATQESKRKLPHLGHHTHTHVNKHRSWYEHTQIPEQRWRLLLCHLGPKGWSRALGEVSSVHVKWEIIQTPEG